MQWLLVIGFGGAGATLGVNFAGCLAIGVLYEVFETHPPLVNPCRIALVSGLLGGFTTFSAFGLETWLLLQSSRAVAAVSYALGSVALGVVGVAAGIALARVAS